MAVLWAGWPSRERRELAELLLLARGWCCVGGVGGGTKSVGVALVLFPVLFPVLVLVLVLVFWLLGQAAIEPVEKGLHG